MIDSSVAQQDGIQALNNLDDIKQIIESIKSAENVKEFSTEKSNAVIKTLESYECWQPLFRYVELRAENAAREEAIHNMASVARIQARCTNDMEGAQNTCKKLVKQFHLSLDEFRQYVLNSIALNIEFKIEADLLESVCSQFSSKKDKIRTVERLCHLFDKKCPNESKLADLYDSLIQLDDKNVKALKYFKLVHLQESEWPEVIEILLKLIELEPEPSRYRIALELSAVYLYHMDDPNSCLDTLNKYSDNNPLDSTTLYYDAYYRKSDWQGCIRILRQSLLKIFDETDAAVIHYKIGSIMELIGDVDGAMENYNISMNKNASILEPIEALVQMYIEQKNWHSVSACLEALKDKCLKDNLKSNIVEAIDRIKECSVN